METGVHSDYKLKEAFIRTEIDTLNEILAILDKMNLTKQEVDTHLENMMLGNKISKDQMDGETLLNLISQASEMIEKIENA
jgi:hypothetical protein